MKRKLTNKHKKKSISKEFGRFFLLQFTEELIKNSGAREILQLKEILREEKIKKEEEKDNIKDIIKKREEKEEAFLTSIMHEKRFKKLEEKILPKLTKPLKQLKKPVFSAKFKHTHISPSSSRTLRILRIPEPRLPLRLRYIRPMPTKEQIDLGKLNPLIRDFSIDTIECNGENKNITISGKVGIKKTEIVLTKEEINEIIDKFSKATKIPVQEGVFNVAIGRLTFSAIISDAAEPRFIIKKMKIPLLPHPAPISPSHLLTPSSQKIPIQQKPLMPLPRPFIKPRFPPQQTQLKTQKVF